MKRVMFTALTALTALALAGCGKGDGDASTASTSAAIAAPAGSKWSETFASTPDSGMLMGNPNAPVKLVEYGALTCSHCATFSEKSGVPLKAMIDKGTVSYEFRNFMLNVIDVPASLLARCAGPGPFFPISEQLFAAQAEWLGKAQTITPAEQQAWQTMAPEQVSPLLAAKLGLDTFVQARGIGPEKARACLVDKAAIAQLEAISQRASQEYKITGTPTFLLNGSVVPETASWEVLEPKLKAAGA